MTDPSREAFLFARIRELDAIEKFSYAEKGMMCKEVKDTMIHRQRINPETGEPCSWTEWVRLAAPWAYGTCFSAVRDMEELKDIAPADLARIPEANFPILRQLSTQVRNTPTVLQAAKTKRSDEFIEHIKREHPGQAIEHSKPMRFMPSETQAVEIEKSLAMSMERGAKNRTEALFDLAINYQADVMMEKLSEELK
jgi:hypothetical protein